MHGFLTPKALRVGISTTVALTSLLPFVVLTAALLSLPVSLLLLRLYRRAILIGMDVRVGAAPPADFPITPNQPPAAALSFIELDAATPAAISSHSPSARHQTAIGLWRAAAVYAASGIAYAGLMTAGLRMSDSSLHGGLIQIAFLGWTYWWPAVLVVLLVAAYDRRRQLQVVGAYAGVFIALVVLATSGESKVTPPELALSWVLLNGPATFLIFAFTLRKIRAVGPLVLTLLLLLAVGSQSLIWLVSANNAVLRVVAEFGSTLGLHAKGVFFALVLVGMLGFGWLAWPLLRWLGRRYESRRFSDQSIVADARFLMFAVVQSVGMAFSGPLWFLTGPVAFAGYKVCTVLCFKLTRTSVTWSPKLLLLRVFRLGPRSEQLFDKLQRHWLPAGSIQMLSGPDLATTTVEPHEFLDFLSGKLGRRFVTGVSDLEQRLANLDHRADPDGRHRIDEFFCHSDTWQMTMHALAVESDAVLMDLRSFSPANQGCTYELAQLLNSVPLGQVLFLVDTTTDEAFLRATQLRAWDQLSTRSPNRDVVAPTARLFRINDESEMELLALCGHLLAH